MIVTTLQSLNSIIFIFKSQILKTAKKFIIIYVEKKENIKDYNIFILKRFQIS